MFKLLKRMLICLTLGITQLQYYLLALVENILKISNPANSVSYFFIYSVCIMFLNSLIGLSKDELYILPSHKPFNFLLGAFFLALPVLVIMLIQNILGFKKNYKEKRNVSTKNYFNI